MNTSLGYAASGQTGSYNPMTGSIHIGHMAGYYSSGSNSIVIGNDGEVQGDYSGMIMLGNRTHAAQAQHNDGQLPDTDETAARHTVTQSRTFAIIGKNPNTTTGHNIYENGVPDYLRVGINTVKP